MRILFINEKFAVSGGSEQYLFDVVSALRKKGHKTAIIYNDREQDQLEDTYYVPDLETDRVIKLALELKPEVIDLQNVFNNDLYRELPKIAPTVRFIHDHRSYSPGSSSMHFISNTICEAPLSWFHQPFFAYLEKCMSRNPLKIMTLISKRQELLKLQNSLKKIMVNSNYVRNRLIQNGAKESLIEVVPLFVDIPKSTLKLHSQKNVILYIGRLFVEKGVDYAIEAMKEVDAELWILGEGWDEERLKRLTKEKNLEGKVRFFGWVSYKTLSAYLEVCKLVVVPSIWPEPFGLSGLMAMSYSKPVVAFDVGGIKDWLKNGEVGFLVPRLDTRGLAQKFNLLIRDGNLNKKMGSKAKKWVGSHFTKEKHIDNLIRIFKEAKG